MKAAIVSFGHVDAVLPLVKNLKKHNLELDLFFCFALNRKSESLIDFSDQKVETGFLSKEKTANILSDGIKKYMVDSSCIQFFLFHNLKLKSLRNIILSFSLAKKLKSYDLIHFNGVDAVLPLLIVQLRKKKLLFTIHDIVAHKGEKTKFNFAERLNEYIIKSKFSLIVLNLSDYNNLISSYPLTSTKLHFIPFGVLDIYREFKSVNSNSQACDLLFFGRISPYKGIEYLIDAIKSLIEKGVFIKTIIAGKGELYFNAQNLDQLDITVLNRYIDTYELTNLIINSKLVICPYTDATQSGVIMTALAFQKPVIASSVGGLKDVIINDYNGILVPPCDSHSLANAISSLITDNKKLAEIEKNILEYEHNNKTFSWESISRKHLNLYQKIQS